MEEVSDANFNNLVLESKGDVLVFFSADWCGYCRVLEPTLKSIQEERTGKLVILYCNVDRTQKHASDYQLQGVPTILLFKDGKPQGSLVGAQPKEAIDNFLNQYC